MNNVVANHVWEQISSLKGEARAEFCLSQGIEAYKNQNYEASAVLCGAAIDIFQAINSSSKYSETLSAYSFSSYSLMKLKRFKEAGCLSVIASNFLYKFNESDGRDAFEFAADCFSTSGDFKDAIAIYEFIISESLSVVSDGELAKLYFEVAYCYQELGIFSVAIYNYVASRKMYLVEGNPKMIAYIDEELSLCHHLQGQSDEAAKYAQLALDYAILMNDRYRLRYSHNRMGLAKIARNELDRALEHLRRAKQLATSESDPDWQFIVENEEQIALIFELKGATSESSAIRNRIQTMKSGTR
jgi:tetratricopeptide (TPR) repeat protein